MIEGRAETNERTVQDDGIQVAELPFEGKNKVLFHFGRDGARTLEGGNG